MTPGYYHYTQLAAMRLSGGGRGQEGYYFEGVVVKPGNTGISSQPPLFKDEYLIVDRGGKGTLIDDDAGYREYMEFSRLSHNDAR